MPFSMGFLPHQGRYLRVYNQARTLAHAGHEVTLVAWDRECRLPRKEQKDGFMIERIYNRAGFQLGPVKNLFRVSLFQILLLYHLLKKEMDVIHCFNLDTLIPGWLVSRIKGCRLTLDLCEPIYYAYWDQKYARVLHITDWVERTFSKKCDYVFVHNFFQLRKFEKYGVKHCEHIGSLPNRSIIVDQPQVPSEGGNVVLGRIGSIYKNNGIEEVIEAFVPLSKEYPQARLLLAGKVYDEFKEDFQRLVEPIRDRVEVVGEFPSSQLPELYRKTDISMQLSRRTVWFQNITPTKFFESLANGVPVITSDIGDCGQLVREAECGVVVDETNVEDIVRGVSALIEDPSLRYRMAENGLKLIKERFNWEAMGEKLVRIYDEDL